MVLVVNSPPIAHLMEQSVPLGREEELASHIQKRPWCWKKCHGQREHIIDGKSIFAFEKARLR